MNLVLKMHVTIMFYVIIKKTLLSQFWVTNKLLLVLISIEMVPVLFSVEVTGIRCRFKCRYDLRVAARYVYVVTVGVIVVFIIVICCCCYDCCCDTRCDFCHAKMRCMFKLFNLLLYLQRSLM